MEIQAICHEKFGKIRTQLVENAPWFVAKDVCKALGIVNHRHATSILNLKERGSFETTTSGGKQKMLHVNESGLYQLIFQSRKLEARQFTRWVTSEVLPSIRRTGGYRLHAKESDALVWYKGVLCIRHRWLTEQGILSKCNIQSKIRRHQIIRVRLGGNGRGCLLLWSSIPKKHKAMIYTRYGELSVPPVVSAERYEVLQDVVQIEDKGLRMRLINQLFPKS